MSVKINYKFQPNHLELPPCVPPITTTKYLPPLNSALEATASICHRTFNNPFFWALVLGTTALTGVVLSTIFLSAPTALLLIFLLCTSAGTAFLSTSKEQKKWLFSEISLMNSTLAGTLPSWIHKHPWHTEITPQITLGAAPLKSRGHFEEVKQSHQAILSLIENFEHEPHLMGVPVPPKDWSQAGLTFLHLPNRDLHPVKLTDVHKGVEWMRRQISRGKKVYVHCLAGVGRSATIVICYLIKYCSYSPKEAVEYVRARRRISVHENSPAIAAFTASLPIVFNPHKFYP